MFPLRILPALSVALFAVFIASEASAQPYPAYRVYPEPPRYRSAIPPHEVAAIVRSLGLMPTSAPRPRGPFWVVDAVGQDSSPIRVRVDAMTGRVADIVRVPGPRMVRVYPGGPPHGAVYNEPVPGGYGPRGPALNEPGYYGDRDDDDYPMKDGPAYGGPGNPSYYGGPRGSLPPAPTGPQIITRGGDVTNSIPQRQAVRTGNDPLLGVPREFRGEQKPKPKTEPKVAAKPAEKTPTAAPLPKPRPADAPSVVKTETKPAETAPAATTKPKQETVKRDLSTPGKFPVQGLE